MKISMYTFLFEIDSKFYAYNTLSNALIEIAEDTYKILLVNKNRHLYKRKTWDVMNFIKL